MRKKAIIFIGFRHKIDSVLAAKNAGYKAVLLTRSIIGEAEKYFDEIFEENILDIEVLKRLVPVLREKYLVKGVVSNYEHYVVHRSFFAERFGIPSCSVYSACCTRNKAMQRHALSFMKENIDYVVVKNAKQAARAAKKLGGKVFLKSISGIKSRLIFGVETEEEMLAAFEQIQNSQELMDQDLYDDYEYCDFNFKYPDPKSNFIVEKAAYGKQITIASLVGDHNIWHAPSICDVFTANDIGRDDSFLAFRILPSRKNTEIQKKAKRATETAARIFGLKNCSIHAEFILSEQGDLKLIEIASRMGGYRAQMYQKAYDLDLNNMLINSVIGKETKTRRKAKKYISLVEIFAKKEGTLTEIKNLEQLKADASVSDITFKRKVGDQVGLAKNGHTQILSFYISGKTYKEVKEKSIYYHELLEVVVD
jgi:biotin carboxylase